MRYNKRKCVTGKRFRKRVLCAVLSLGIGLGGAGLAAPEVYAANETAAVTGQTTVVSADITLGNTGKTVALSATVSKIKDGWDAAKKHYYVNGEMVTGPRKIGRYWYYFSKKTGAVQKNKFVQVKKNKICYYDSKGRAVKGEQKIGKYYYYFNRGNCKMVTNAFQEIPGTNKTCYYNKNGHRVTGLKKIGKYYYYFAKNTGVMQKGFQTITRNGQEITCYFTSKGRMATGDRTIKNVIYSFDKKTGALEEMMIAHASGDERGEYYYGQAGDQTRTEVCVRSWYNRPWNCVLRPKSTAMAEKIATAMERAADNDNIGYDMAERNTLYYNAKKVGWDPGLVTQLCETDCSALVSLACIYAGVSPSILFQEGNSSVTWNLRSRLEGTGKFITYTTSAYIKGSSMLRRGDILLYEGHHTGVVTGKWKRK